MIPFKFSMRQYVQYQLNCISHFCSLLTVQLCKDKLQDIMFENLILMNTFRNTAIGCMYQNSSVFKFHCSGLLSVPLRTKTGPSLAVFCTQGLKLTVFTYTVYIKYAVFPSVCFGGQLPSSRSNTQSMYDLRPNEATNTHTHAQGRCRINILLVIMCNKSHSYCIYYAVSTP